MPVSRRRCWDTGAVHARSAVVNLYGDHLREHHWWAPVAGVVTLSASCGVQPAATRTAISRLVREGWLVGERRHGARGYAATPVAQERLAHAHARIYSHGPRPWDGSWHLLVVDADGDRRRRDRVAATLGYLGYGRLATGAWASPWRSDELDDALAAQGATWTGWTARPEEGTPGGLSARLWDLDSLARDYRRFGESLPVGPLDALSGEEAYRLRTVLVHEWRKFLFRDPGLPAHLLPPDWPGQAVRERLLDVAARLRPAASDFVADVLGAGASEGSPGPGRRAEAPTRLGS